MGNPPLLECDVIYGWSVPEGGVHGRVPDELARLDRHPRQQVATTLAHAAAEEESETRSPF